ncbi:unnamed protein product [Schistosoma curassoni]|uniref:DnaJ_C domain-containing protein n=1 Tax=Schistosoma curassoni TaxID=6186 RepID=A0A183KRM4_9TREM|nr:unnamed protein product [Schistosoma curassoni]
MLISKGNFDQNQRSRPRFFGIQDYDDNDVFQSNDDNENGGRFTNTSTTTSGYSSCFTSNTTNDNDSQTIFQFDEMFGQSTCKDIDQCWGSNLSDSPPLGRPRRANPKPLTGRYEVEFPGIFVEGFRGGHVKFNIPGVLQGSLKPTDSMIVKINVPSPEQFHLSEVYDQSSFGNSTQTEGVSQNRETSTVSTSRFATSCFEQNTHQTMSDHCSTTMPYTSDILSNLRSNHPNPSDSYQLNSTDTNKSDAHLLRCGTTTECSTISSNLCSSSRFPSVYERISTDSGLPSNYLIRPVISGHRKIVEEDNNDRGGFDIGGGERNPFNFSNENNQLSRFGQFGT